MEIVGPWVLEAWVTCEGLSKVWAQSNPHVTRFGALGLGPEQLAAFYRGSATGTKGTGDMSCFEEPLVAVTSCGHATADIR